MKPRLLDLFCGAGGCSVGYDRAGFDVTGVDIEHHDDYPFELIVGDAMERLADVDFLNEFDVVHASPPCPFYSTATIESARDRHPDLVPPTFAALRAWGGTWVIENVPGAPMPGAVVLCGQAMGLPRIKRHRLFASSAALMSPGCACGAGEVVGVYGGKRGWGRNAPRPDGTSRGRRALTHAEACEVMGIDWMTKPGDVSDAIPPNYTEYIGGQLIDQLERAA